MSVQPIFLLSQPRSGSTVVQRVLGAHAEIATASEPWVLLPLLAARLPGGYERGRLRSRLHGFSVIGITEFARALPGGEDEWYAQIREFGLGLYAKAAGGKRFFLDKTPGYAPFVDELMRAFPDAKFVFLWRHPLAVASSRPRQTPSGRWNAHRYRASLFDSLVALVSAYARDPDRVVAVRYEDLVAGEGAWREVAAYLGIEFDPDALQRFGETPLEGTLGDPDRDIHRSLVSERLDAWHDVVDNPVRVAWCRRYLHWIGRERLATMGYDIDLLLAELDALPTGGNRRAAAADLVSLGWAAVREAAKARLPPHHGDPSVWRMLLGRREGR